MPLLLSPRRPITDRALACSRLFHLAASAKTYTTTPPRTTPRPPPLLLLSPLVKPDIQPTRGFQSRQACGMSPYVPPRMAKKKKRIQERAAATAANAKLANGGMNPASQVFIPGLTLIPQQQQQQQQQQPDDASPAEPPLPGLLPPPPPPPPKPTPQRKFRREARKESRKESRAGTPSEESGGVPDPTPQYMAQAFLAPSTLPEPRRILIVMDLNGTLLHRPNRKQPFKFVERPHARSFLAYCLDTFYVAIWSSARPENVSKMVDQLLADDPAQRDRCLVVWARNRFGLSDVDYNCKVQVYKRLTSIWADPHVAGAHPTGGRWDQTNTVLVDDSREKARSEPCNLLRLPEFSGLETEAADVLPQVHDYLNGLSYQADISRYMRIQPFKLDANFSLS